MPFINVSLVLHRFFLSFFRSVHGILTSLKLATLSRPAEGGDHLIVSLHVLTSSLAQYIHFAPF